MEILNIAQTCTVCFFKSRLRASKSLSEVCRMQHSIFLQCSVSCLLLWCWEKDAGAAQTLGYQEVRKASSLVLVSYLQLEGHRQVRQFTAVLLCSLEPSCWRVLATRGQYWWIVERGQQVVPFSWVQLFAQHAQSVYILISAACHMLTFLLYTMDANCSLVNSIVSFVL